MRHCHVRHARGGWHAGRGAGGQGQRAAQCCSMLRSARAPRAADAVSPMTSPDLEQDAGPVVRAQVLWLAAQQCGRLAAARPLLGTGHAHQPRRLRTQQSAAGMLQRCTLTAGAESATQLAWQSGCAGGSCAAAPRSPGSWPSCVDGIVVPHLGRIAWTERQLEVYTLVNRQQGPQCPRSAGRRPPRGPHSSLPPRRPPALFTCRARLHGWPWAPLQGHRWGRAAGSSAARCAPAQQVQRGQQAVGSPVSGSRAGSAGAGVCGPVSGALCPCATSSHATAGQVAAGAGAAVNSSARRPCSLLQFASPASA